MAYLKPPLVTRRLFNPLAMRLGIGGAETLVVRRRRTGELQRIPVIPVSQDGVRHIVSTRGESDWVRNMRAAGGGELESRSGRRAFTAVELPVSERAPVIAAYRALAGRTVEPYFRRLPDPVDHPVFRVQLRDE